MPIFYNYDDSDKLIQNDTKHNILKHYSVNSRFKLRGGRKRSHSNGKRGNIVLKNKESCALTPSLISAYMYGYDIHI